MKLTHDTIGDLQAGGIGLAINQGIGEAMRDCENRPGLDKARKVVIEVSFTPGGAAMQDGPARLSTVGIKAAVKVSVPNRVGDTDFLAVSSGADAHGEPEIAAHFAQVPLLNGKEN